MKETLVNIDTGYNVGKINANFQKIQNALNDKVLYRDNPDGEPNLMSNDLDMNGHKLLNVDSAALIEDLSPELGEAVDQVEAARDETVIARNEAVAAADNANAAIAVVEGYADAAEVSSTNAAASEAAALAAVASIPVENAVSVISSISLVSSNNQDVLYANATAGNITITAPLGATVGEPFSFFVKKTDSSANSVSVALSGTDTFEDGTSSYLIEDQNQGAKFIVDTDTSPDTWIVIPFGAPVGDTESLGAMKVFPNLSSLTAGGDYLEINGSYFLVSGWPELASLVYCGDSNNPTASYWYRFTDPANPSTTRSVSGSYMKLPPRSAYTDIIFDGVLGIKATNTVKIPVDTDLTALLADVQETNALITSLAEAAPDYSSGATAYGGVNTTTTWTHGLGVVPRRVRVYAKFKTAQNNYAVGDIVEVAGTSGSISNNWHTVSYNSTTIKLSNSAGIMVSDPVGHGSYQINAANVDLFCEAWKEDTFAFPAPAAVAKQTITGNAFPLVMGIQTISHTLGKVPSRVEVRARCTAAEYGYAVGDGFTVWTAGPNNSDGGYSVINRGASSISLGWAGGYGSGKILKQIRKDTVAVANLTTNGNWVYDLELYE